MIDREKRDLLIKSLSKLLDGNLSVKEFDKINFITDDNAIIEILQEVSYICDDVYSGFFNHQKKLASYKKCFLHFILFLSTDLEYEWPYPYPTIKHRFKRLCTILTFGLLPFFREVEYERFGDFGVWPFLREGDFEKAKNDFPNIEV
ncbi:MAG: hypothetical protein WCV67_18970 [Victivallaceae bacterium]|jgi:hypothetical protein